MEQEVGGSEDELYSGDTWHTPPEPGDQGQRQPWDVMSAARALGVM